MGYIADHARRFFHPAAIEEMLSTFVPLIDGSQVDVSNSFGRYSSMLTKDVRAFLHPNIIC
jgi:hypothetical protein